MRKYFLTVGIFAILLASLFGYKFYENYQSELAKESYTSPPISVTAAKATESDWQPFLSSVGTLEAVNGVNVAPLVAGVVKTINFSSGQMVKKDQVLIELDTSVLEAQLQNAIAAKNLAGATFRRYSQLIKKKAIADTDFDTARSEYNQAIANVNSIKAQIGQMKILAPFSGKLGLRLVNLGQYLAPGTKITTLQTVNPMLINFPIPAQEFTKLKVGEKIQLNLEVGGGQTYDGKLTAISSEVDQLTRSVMVQAEVDNTDGVLVPGMFADVKVLLPMKKNVVVVPSDAVSYTLYGDSIFVLTEPEKNNQYTAKLKLVKVGESRDGKTEILSGVKSGDIVVTSGQLKLQNNSKVEVVTKTENTTTQSQDK